MPALMIEPDAFLAFATVLGLLVGSFLNVVIHRLPIMLEREWHAQCAALDGEPVGAEDGTPYNLVVPGSACPHCGHGIRWFENIPLLSYVLLRGRCSACGQPISPRYPVVEAAAGLLAAYAAWHFGPGAQAAAAMGLAWALIALTVIDLDTHLLPDRVTQPLLWAGLIVNLWGVFSTLQQAVVGAVSGYLTLWAVYHAFRLATGKEGMGYGDFKLLAALGAWLGWKALPIVILGSSVVGAVVGGAMILFAGHDRARPIPFGPWLALGGLIALFWGDPIWRWYLGP
jgi:leader peptidase (prepilin peptidase) / N-methyltransferase